MHASDKSLALLLKMRISLKHDARAAIHFYLSGRQDPNYFQLNMIKILGNNVLAEKEL